jgi:hypothetical protein
MVQCKTTKHTCKNCGRLVGQSKKVNGLLETALILVVVAIVVVVCVVVWDRKLLGVFVGDASGDDLGKSVALSADASILVIGANGHNNNTGYVKVYRTDDDGKNRVQLGETVYGDATEDNFGLSVDITPDGMTIICGSPGYGVDDRPGYVRVFSLEGDSDLGTDNWKQIGQDIIGEMNGDEFGTSVSISGDGKTIAIGAPENDGINGEDSGHVRMYRLVDAGTSWQKIGQDINGEGAGDWSGRSVSLSVDGSTVAIGAPYNDKYDSDSGQVAVYRINGEGSSWERLGQSMYGDIADDQFGLSISLSPDGNILAIGSPARGRKGYARVFSLTNGDDTDDADTWKQIGQDMVSHIYGDYFGWSISLSDDGKTVAVGACKSDGINRNYDYIGSVSVYRMDESGTNWIQVGDGIDGMAEDDWSGYSVSLSADGNKVAIGSPSRFDSTSRYGSTSSGHVRVYALK